MMSAAPASPAPKNFRAPTGAEKAVIGLLGLLVVAFCVMLWPEWRQNPDLSHGFLAPLVFVILLRESRRQGTTRWLPATRWVSLARNGTLCLGFSLFAVAGLLAASVAWSHALVLFVLAAALTCFLLGGLLILAGDQVRLQPFNWIGLTAIFLWLLVAPLPNGTYARLTLGLQGWVTGAVLQTLHLLGIPARQHGNVIELATTTVGIAEACSGIRSLLSCVYAGFFFAAWQLRRPARRAALVVWSVLLALGMNFFRSLLLTLMANAGRDISGFWHDATVFAILGATALLLAAFARLLETPAPPAGADRASDAGPRDRPTPVRFFWFTTAATLALAGFFFVHTRPAARAGQPAPNLAALMPQCPPGWEMVARADLYQFADILQTTHLLERTYVRLPGQPHAVQVNVYIAYWPAGQATVSRVASHTPDACWPGSGWIAQPVADPQQFLPRPGQPIAAAEHRMFRSADGSPQHVWFWHVYNGHAISYQNPYSVPALLQLALRYGFRRQGEQFFVRISSNVPWAEIGDEPLVHDLLTRLAATGL